MAGYYDKNGEWHQQGLTPDQLKELSQRKEQLQKEEEKLRIEQYKVDELARLMKEVQEKAVETHEQLADNMRVFECQQAYFEQEKANLQTQMKALVEERNAVKKCGLMQTGCSKSPIKLQIFAALFYSRKI